MHDQQNVAALLADTYFILAEDDLAQGNRAASEEYRAAEAQLRNPGVNPEFTVAGALTDLSLMETERPGLTGEDRSAQGADRGSGRDLYAKRKPYETHAGGEPTVRGLRQPDRPARGHQGRALTPGTRCT